MGIIKLMQFISTHCGSAISHHSPLHYKNKYLAIDTPSSIYKFLVKTITSTRQKINIPTDSKGNQTGHLIGIMYRALLCMQVGIKPIWVFDGKPPIEKLSQLKRRKTLKQQASTKSQQALSLGDMLQAAKQSQRNIKVTKQEIQDTIKMLNLMGMPTIRSYSQAEAQCAWLTKKYLAQGVISEDLDNIAFGSKYLIRDFGRDKVAQEISHQKVLQTLKLTQDQFIDFCILCGCDYTRKISGIGPIKAYKFITQNKTLENVIKYIINDDKLRKRHSIPDDFSYLRARYLFKNPIVDQSIKFQNLQIKQIDQNGLRQFLMQKQFDQARVNKWIKLAQKFKPIQENVI